MTNDQNSEEYTFVDKRRAPESNTETADSGPAEATSESGSESDLPDSEAAHEDLEDASSTHQIALYALGLLQMNAFQQLGLISEPKTGKSVRDLDQAKVAIDCVSAIAGVLDSPDSTLEPRLRQDLRRIVTDLRLNFVTQSKLAAEQRNS
jgi:hypothetical protein